MIDPKLKLTAIVLAVLTVLVAGLAITQRPGVKTARETEVSVESGNGTGSTRGGTRHTDGSPAANGQNGTSRGEHPVTGTEGTPGEVSATPGDGSATPLPGAVNSSDVPTSGGIVGALGPDGQPILLDKDGNPLDPAYAAIDPESQQGADDIGDDSKGAEPSPTPGPGQATLAGHVLRGSKPVEGAIINLFGSNDLFLESNSNAAGEFYFPPLAAGDYVLILQHPPSPNSRRSVTLAENDKRINEDFVLSALPGVEGNVVNDANGEAVANPRITILQGVRGFGEVNGDAQGHFTLVPLEAGSYTLEVVADGYRQGEKTFTIPDDPSHMPTVEVRLEAAVNVTGRVIVEGGSPGAGARVSLFSPGAVWDGPYSSVPMRTSGSDGSFQFSSLPAGGGPLMAGAYLQGLLPGYSPLLDPATSETGVLGDVILTRGARVTGRIVNSDGEGIPYTKIEVIGGFATTGAVYQKFNATLPTAESGEDGRFALTPTEPGFLLLRFTVTDYQTTERDFTVQAPESDLGDVKLLREDETEGGTLLGIVVDNEGRGIAGSNVWIQCIDCPNMNDALQTTDSLGRFTFEDLVEGSYKVELSGSTLRGDLFIPLNQRFVGARPGEPRGVYIYDLSHSLKMKLVDGGGSPVRKCLVGLNVTDESGSAVGGYTNRVYMQYEKEFTSAEGEYTLANLISGNLNLAISSDAGTKELQNVAIGAGSGPIDLGTITIGEGATIHGDVVAQENGVAIQGATVAARPPVGSEGGHPLQALNISGTTNITGEFTLRGLPVCQAQLVLEKSGRVLTRSSIIDVRGGAINEAGTIQMLQSATVEGTVTDSISGDPIYNVQISFNNVTVFTDRQGQYRTDRAEPGHNNMIAVHNYQGNRHETVHEDLELMGGQTIRHDFQMVPEE